MRRVPWRTRLGAWSVVTLVGAGVSLLAGASPAARPDQRDPQSHQRELERQIRNKTLTREQAREVMMAFHPCAAVAAPRGGSAPAPRRLPRIAPADPREVAGAREGLLIIEALIDRQGGVREARLLRAIAKLDRATLDILDEWTYSPTVVNTETVAAIMTLRVSDVTDAGADWGFVPPSPRTPAADAARTPFLIERHRVGLVQIGMSIDEVCRAVPAEQITLGGGSSTYYEPALDIWAEPRGPRPAVTAAMAYMDGWRVTSLSVTDPRFLTADALGVDSTFGELQAVYPDLRISSFQPQRISSPRGDGLTFFLEGGRAAGDPSARVQIVQVLDRGVGVRLPENPPELPLPLTPPVSRVPRGSPPH